MAFQRRKRSEGSSLAQFVFGDWKVVLQITLLFVVAFAFESIREVLKLFPPVSGDSTVGLRTPESLAHLPNFLNQAGVILQTNALWMASLFFPAILFLFAGKCVAPHLGLVLKRLVAFAAFALFVAFSIAGSAHSKEDLFRWSVDSAFRSTNIFSASSAALVLFSVLVICYRFVVLAKGFFTGLLRLATVFVLLAAVIYSDHFLKPRFLNSNLAPIQEMKMVVVLKDLSFEEGNRFLTTEAEEPLLNSIVQFRPVLMPSNLPSSQLATLLSGRLPYEHGLRLAGTTGASWNLFKKSLMDQFTKDAANFSFHVTNITTPSTFERFVPEQISGSRCPDRDSNKELYFTAERVKGRMAAFLPRWAIRSFVPLYGCQPLGVPVDDIIHYEMLDEMAGSSRFTSKVTSIWYVDLEAFEAPQGTPAVSEAQPEKGAADHTKLQKRRNLALVLKTLLSNMELLGNLEKTELHVIGLNAASSQEATMEDLSPEPGAHSREKPGQSYALGTYFFAKPKFTRQASWPLEDENRLIGLAQLSSLIKPGSKATQSLYFEHTPTRKRSANSASGKQLALLTQRMGLCSQLSLVSQASTAAPVNNSTDRTKLMMGSFRLAEASSGFQWTETNDSEVRSESVTTAEKCRREITNSIENSIEQDVQLLEPYVASPEIFELSKKMSDEHASDGGK